VIFVGGIHEKVFCGMAGEALHISQGFYKLFDYDGCERVISFYRKLRADNQCFIFHRAKRLFNPRGMLVRIRGKIGMAAVAKRERIIIVKACCLIPASYEM